MNKKSLLLLLLLQLLLLLLLIHQLYLPMPTKYLFLY